MNWRANSIRGGIIVLFVALLFRIGYLQLYQGQRYWQLAENNRLRVDGIDPVRGTIFDRKGRVMVENYPVYTVVGTTSALVKTPQTLNRLRQLFPDSSNYNWEEQISRSVNFASEVKLKRDLRFEELAEVEANMLFLPGIEVKIESKRKYPYHTAVHLLGYIGEINASELAVYKDFNSGDIIGRQGIEKQYNSLLFGKRGYNVFEVDAVGNKIRSVKGIKDIPAVNGNDIYLTIDLDLQLLAEELLGASSGAVVAMDPQNGDILALVSHPDYEAEIFSGVVSSKDWNSLLKDLKKPLLNRAIQGAYPPGSAIKMVILAAALEEGIVSKSRAFSCPGYYQLGDRVFKCWNQKGHGSVKAVEAVEQSCDVYFYNLGLRLGIERMAKYFRLFGFGSTTGIDIEGESAGLIPDRKYWDRRYGVNNWGQGFLLNTAIGQGDVLVTPMQLVRYCAAIANGGYLVQPHLYKGTIFRNPDYWQNWEPKSKMIEGISPQTLEILREGMYEVVQGGAGTAHWLMNPAVAIAGKTGTAQNPHGDDHAWFIGFAPYERPVISVCALVEHGEHGSSAAAPIVVKMIERYLQMEKLTISNPATKAVG